MNPKMKSNHPIHKLISTITAASVLIGAFAVLPKTFVDAAAGDMSSMFIDNITKVESRSAMLLDGETITTHIKVPENYHLKPSEDETFELIERNDGITTGELPFKATPEGNIKAMIPAGKEMATYSIRPAFDVFLREADSGLLKAKIPNPTNPDDIITRNIGFDAKVTSNDDISITKTGKITLTVNNDMTAVDDILSFDNAVATEGLATDFDGATVSLVRTQGTTLVLNFSKLKNIRLELNIASLTQVYSSLRVGTTFEITFAVQTTAPMQLTILTPKKAVELITGDIAATANFSQFITLAPGDTATSIKSQFKLLHIAQRYNSEKGFNIKWTWVPETDTELNKKVLSIPQTTNKEWLGTTRPQLEDTPGKLNAVVTYPTDTSDTSPTGTADISIIIVGTGIMPSFLPIYSYQGKIGEDGVYKNDPIPIDEVPGNMDVNDGKFSKDFPGEYPYQFEGELKYGTGIGKAQNIAIDFGESQNGEAEIFIDRSTTPYVPGTKLVIPADAVGSEVTRSVRVRAKSEGLVRLRIYYYNSSGAIFNGSPETYNIDVADTSAGKDATLKSLVLKGVPLPNEGDPTDPNSDYFPYEDAFKAVYPNGLIPFGFSPENEKYDTISVPYAVKEITFTPTYNDIKLHGSQKKVDYKITNYGVNGVGDAISGTEVKVLEDGAAISLPENEPLVIYINGTAEDGKEISSYRLTITRQPRSDVASLSSLEVKTPRDDKTHTLTPAFNPILYGYELHLPYYYVGAKTSQPPTADDPPSDTDAIFTAIAQGEWGSRPKYTSNYLVDAGIFARIFQNKNQAKVDLRYEVKTDTDGNETVANKNTVIIKVTPEDKSAPATYTVDIIIDDPSDNNMLNTLKVSTNTRANGNVDIPFYNNAQFDKDRRDYDVDIKYLYDNLKFEFMPDNEFAQKVEITKPDGTLDIINYTKKGQLISKKYEIDKAEPTYEKEFIYQFRVLSEDGKWTEEPYNVRVTRQAPSSDARLASLDVTDTATGTPAEEYIFVKDQIDYTFNVPYTTESVLITPVANMPEFAVITVDDNIINEGRPSREIALKPGQTAKVVIVVVPESGDADKKTYTLNITRLAPSTEARLQNLVVGGSTDMKPAPFVPATTSYTASIPEGTKTFTITPTLVDPAATIKINGKAAANGQAFGPITSIDATTTYTIVVTAQDTKTTKTYTLTITDYNLVKKSSAAYLTGIDLNYADLKPAFQSGIDTYQVFLKPEAKKLELVPHAVSRATVAVAVGSKALTSYGGKYATSSFTNKDVITITVTPEDGSTENVKTYTLNMIKNDKKEQGAFKPITAEMVNYEEADPIIIDISNYAIVDASVFNKLKTDHPKKSIVFTGNDYMLKIKGEDMKELVPHTTQFDLSFSFTTPEEQMIDSIIWSSDRERDWDIEPVYLYFDDHGPLPAQMLLTVSLGREYRNSPLYWNYFNPERNRIDYYGYVNSNAKGTITVPITHLSTYMVTQRKLFVSEDKTNMGFGSLDSATDGSVPGSGTGNDNANKTDDKNIPQTGVSGGDKRSKELP